jgi:hypothetical protein
MFALQPTTPDHVVNLSARISLWRTLVSNLS